MKSLLYIIGLASLFLMPAYGQTPGIPTNYIRKKVYTNETATTCMQSTVYYNSDGKPEQTVEKGITPDGKDLVHFIEYDKLGRAAQKYVPLPTIGNGEAVTISTVINQLNSLYPGEYPYTETVYETSALNRPLSTRGPGKAWHDANKSDKSDYVHNTASGIYACGYFTLSGTNIIRNGNYPASELYVQVATDENDVPVYTFTDKMERIVLERRTITSGTYADTYYLYNSFGMPVYILPSEASDRMAANTTYTAEHEAIKNYAYSYEYDDLLRKKTVKLPGADPVYMLYDAGWRPALTQDGEQRLRGEWNYFRYDAQSRITEEGIYTSSLSRDALTNSLSTLYDISSQVSSGSQWLKRNYYDAYSFLTTSDTELNYQEKSGYGVRYFYLVGGTDFGSKGLLCGTKVKTLSPDGTSSELTSTFYYNIHGHIIQQKSTNLLGGYDKKYIQYNFVGNPTSQLLEHSTSTRGNVTERYRIEYDHAQRETKKYYQLNGGTEILLSEKAYTDLGQLKEERLHNNMEQTLYRYNLRGWPEKLTSSLTSGNRIDFEQKLFYITNPLSGGKANYNGNISAFRWKNGTDNIVRGYSFSYDGLNQILNSTYGEGTSLNTNTGRYNELQTYDKLGNIKTLQRKGKLSDASFGMLDNLTLTYTGNQLFNVNDACTNQPGDAMMEFKNVSGSGMEYVYNKNGQLTKDLNKDIVDIQWNSLHLPKTVTFSSGNKVAYCYDYNGNKLQVTYPSAPYENKDYAGNKIYRNGSLWMILTDAGYITKEANNSFVYHYYLKDHLGNNRIVLNQNGVVEQATNFYPFGLSFDEGTGTSVQPYKYNNKEFDSMYALNLYDYGARFMEPALGKFTSMDPLSEKYYSVTPYAYCANNPVKYIDPDGKVISPYYDRKGNFLGVDASGYNGLVFISTKEGYRQSMQMKATLSSTVRLQNANLTSEAYSKIYTDVLKQSGYDLKAIENGQISVKNGTDTYNNPSNSVNLFAATTYKDSYTISVNQREPYTNKLLTTVENISNALGAHEYKGHIINNYGDNNKLHYKAYELQLNDATWQNTTGYFKYYMYNLYAKKLGKMNPDLYYKKHNEIEMLWKMYEINQNQ